MTPATSAVSPTQQKTFADTKNKLFAPRSGSNPPLSRRLPNFQRLRESTRSQKFAILLIFAAFFYLTNVNNAGLAVFAASASGARLCERGGIAELPAAASSNLLILFENTSKKIILFENNSFKNANNNQIYRNNHLFDRFSVNFSNLSIALPDSSVTSTFHSELEPPLELSFESAFVPSFSPSPIVRGANLSEFAIDPFRGRFFGYVDGGWGTQDEQNSTQAARGFEITSFGGGVGQDWKLGTSAIWGYGIQGEQLKIDPASSFYDTNVDSLAGFLHMCVFGSLWRLDLSIGTAKNWNEQSYSFQDVNKFSSTQWIYETEFGIRFDKGYTRVEPLVNFRVLTLQEPRAAEKYLASNQRPNEFSDASFRLKLGSRFSWEYATRFSTLKPFLIASWAHEFGNRAIYTSGESSPFPVAYRFGAHRMSRDRLDLGGGVDAALRDSVDLFFQYDVEFAPNYIDYLFFAGFNKKF